MANILIIDDDVNIRTPLSMLLSDSGYNVTVAEDGEQGLNLANISMPDLIILDYNMPKLSGIEMLTKFRENPAGINVPIIVLTNTSSIDIMNQLLLKGVSQYFIKSEMSLDRVQKIVEETLAK
jgi:DNA-binding response OmpR family regulator